MIRLYNSLSRQVEEFVPDDPTRVTMYVCGPTVYDTPHLGNARPSVIFDVLASLLAHEYGDGSVQYARNITDIDDKIIDRAFENDEPIDRLTERTVAEYHEIMRLLDVQSPDFEPRATQTIPAIIDMISTLVAKGNAYEADGHVLFDVASYAKHGILSGHKQEDLDAGKRVAVADYKRSPGDFVLWKPSSDNKPGWDSPWGFGRPGWHIECSAMINETLGQTIDIHGGGADLRFPHHECEISQSCCANDTSQLARYWMHNAMVLVNGEKMSKSLGNFVTVRDAIADGHKPQTLRLWLLSAHYRSPLDYTAASLENAAQTLLGWHRMLDGIDAPPELNEYAATILQALSSDLNTPLAITRIHDAMSHIGDPVESEPVAAGIRYAADILGLDLTNNDFFLRGDGPVREEIEGIIEQRLAARELRDWATSDVLRQRLTDLGVVVEDRHRATQWRMA